MELEDDVERGSELLDGLNSYLESLGLQSHAADLNSLTGKVFLEVKSRGEVVVKSIDMYFDKKF